MSQTAKCVKLINKICYKMFLTLFKRYSIIFVMDKINGKYIKNLRESSGYSIRAFAQLIYVSKSSLQRWEQTYMPANDDILKRIAQVTGVPEEQIIAQSAAMSEKGEELSPDQRAEVKFGLKGLRWIAVLACVVVVLALVFPILAAVL